MIAERASAPASSEEEESSSTNVETGLFEGMSFPSVPRSKVIVASRQQSAEEEEPIPAHVSAEEEKVTGVQPTATVIEELPVKEVAPISDDIIGDLLGTTRTPASSSLNALYPVQVSA